MGRFSYIAYTQDGKKDEGFIEERDQTSAAHTLKAKGLRVVTIREFSGKEKKDIIPARIGVVERIFFTQNLYIMIRTGFSLAEALTTLAKQTSNKRFKGIIEKLEADVEKGTTLSKALARFPKIFNELFVNMVAAGEVSGKLEDVLLQLTTQMKKDHQLMAKVKSALTYPVIIVSAMLLIGIGMIVYVIPQIQFIFESAEAQLPLPTRIMLGLSDAIQNYGLYIVIALGILAYLYKKFLQTQKGKHIVHKIMLKMPIMGNITKKINTARFTRTLSSLLKTDIPIVQSFLIIEKTLGNIYYREAMHEASEQVKEGTNIVKVLEKYPELFSPILTQMISVGEQSGTLELIAEEIAVFYEDEVDQTMSTLPTILEPVIMILIGAAAGALVAAIILPIYSLSEAI